MSDHGKLFLYGLFLFTVCGGAACWLVGWDWRYFAAVPLAVLAVIGALIAIGAAVPD